MDSRTQMTAKYSTAMYKMMTKMFMMMMMKKKMTAVSRNLAINFVSSKLGPFIRGHDLPNSPIVNDDDLHVLGDKEISVEFFLQWVELVFLYLSCIIITPANLVIMTIG